MLNFNKKKQNNLHNLIKNTHSLKSNLYDRNHLEYWVENGT